jgi:hypothetical protein
LKYKSLLNVLNKKCPSGEQCGNPESVGKGEGNFPRKGTMENLDDKLLWN